MAGPIYKSFHARWTEAWYQLTEEQREALFGKMNETAERLGVKSMVICDSSGNSEKWLFWGVEEYPDMEAVQEYTRCLVELNSFRYCDSETLLGTRVPSEPAE